MEIKKNSPVKIRAWAVICVLFFVGLIIFIRKVITNYILAAILMSVIAGILVGLAGYGFLIKKVGRKEPSRTMIAYWTFLILGSLLLWKWFSFSPHVFDDIMYLFGGIGFSGVAVVRLIAYYFLKREQLENKGVRSTQAVDK